MSCAFGVASLVLAAGAQGEDLATVSLHLSPADYAGCGGFDPDSSDCSTLEVEGDSTGYQFAFVIVSGLTGIEGLQFGVEYDSTLTVTGWQSCNGGLAIPESGWPASGTGYATTWSSPYYPTSTDSLAIVGYFTIGSGSTGTLRVVADGRVGELLVVTASDGQDVVRNVGWGVADVGGGGEGYSACGLVSHGTQEPEFVVSDLDGFLRSEVPPFADPVWINDLQNDPGTWHSVNEVAAVRWSPYTGLLATLVNDVGVYRHNTGGTYEGWRSLAGSGLPGANETDRLRVGRDDGGPVEGYTFGGVTHTVSGESDIRVLSIDPLNDVDWTRDLDARDDGGGPIGFRPNDMLAAVHLGGGETSLFVAGSFYFDGGSHRPVLYCLNSASGGVTAGKTYHQLTHRRVRSIHPIPSASGEGFVVIANHPGGDIYAMRTTYDEVWGDPEWTVVLTGPSDRTIRTYASATDPTTGDVAVAFSTTEGPFQGPEVIGVTKFADDETRHWTLHVFPDGVPALIDTEVRKIEFLPDGDLLVGGMLEGRASLLRLAGEGGLEWVAQLPNPGSVPVAYRGITDFAIGDDGNYVYGVGEFFDDDSGLDVRRMFVLCVSLEDGVAIYYGIPDAVTLEDDVSEWWGEAIEVTSSGVIAVGGMKGDSPVTELDVILSRYPFAQALDAGEAGGSPEQGVWIARSGPRIELRYESAEPAIAVVYDVAGRRMATARLDGPETVSFDEFAAGVYFVEVRVAGGSLGTQKVWTTR
jgi:hypothetical protein